MKPSGLKIRSRDINTLVDIITSHNPDAKIEVIKKAYDYAYEAHKDQYRLSGEPYIIHPLEVAIILANIGLDTTTITAALLHDVVEDTGITLNTISENFDTDTSLLVDGVTNISSIKKRTKSNEQALTLRKMLSTTIKDARVIIIKLADKLHNMRTIMFQPEDKQRQISKEVLDIYAPMAGRLGMSKIRAELEDIAFQVLHEDEYMLISENLAQKNQEIEDYIEKVKGILLTKIDEYKIKAEITGRAKHYYSIYRKMKSQDLTLGEIFDIRAIRIITDDVKSCYGILGITHTIWMPIVSRFKDYIAVPKSNMYQSLHTTVIGPDGQPLEIQIRTRDMHRTSEIGIAAHWLYKEDPATLQKHFKNLTLLKNINKWSPEMKDTREFMKELKMDLYHDEIFVFTPKGKIIKLAKGSTPIDFAYEIHTEVGNHCIGSKVNNKIAALKTELKSGDIVEILTSKKGHPSESWLKYVKSSDARYKIRSWIRKNKEKASDIQPDKYPIKENKTAEVSIPQDELVKIKSIRSQKHLGISIDGASNVLIKLSQCCQPIPGDEVVGYITRGRGITIHNKNCASLKRLQNEPERFINVVWESSTNTYPIKIAVYATDRPNLLKDIAYVISLSKTNIIKAEAQSNKDDTAIFKFILEVRSVAHMEEIITKIMQIKHVTHAFKLNEKVILK
ncbi:MAG: bifunctional (p)ppGpp synthetase/guanosine-3',5'-bis(diphosphate) 3'-pyrophosphohydrolase [Spirochaetota bacterium]|nr:bifunctional (p)ppGpp synthetase/guanosine-3',5'-bis(diphosphate) 3'-pyrophosphohydrolase [Spirochaetota bacterium]